MQAQFAGVLVGRRKRYAAALRTTLMDTLDIRHRADYQPQPITRREAHEALQRARRLVAAVEENIPWRQRSSD